MGTLAQAFVKVRPEVDRDAKGRLTADIKAAAAAAGDEGGKTMGSRVGANMLGRLKDDIAGKLGPVVATEAAKAGTVAGGSLAAGISSTAAQDVPALFTPAGAIGASAIAVAAVALGPAIGAALSSGILLGLGGAALAAAFFAAKDNPAIKAALAGLKASVGNAFKGAADPLVLPFAAAIKTIGSALAGSAPAIRSALAGLAPAIAPLAAGLAGFITNLLPGLSKALAASAPLLTQLGKDLPGLATAISRFLDLIAKSGPNAATFLRDAVTALGNLIVGVGHVIEFLTGAYVRLRTIALTVRSWLIEAYQAVVGFFAAIPGRIGAILNTVAAWATGVWRAVTGLFTALPGQILGALKSLPSLLSRVAEEAKDRLLFAFGFAIGSIVKEFLSLPGQIWAILRSLWSVAVGIVGAGVSAVINWVQQLPGRVASILGSMRAAAISVVSSAISAVVGWFAQLPGRAVGAMSGLAGAVRGALAGAAGWLVHAGEDIIMGLVHGMQGAIGAAINAAVDAAKRILAGIKSALGIASPSRLFAEQVGKPIVQGIAAGIAGNVGLIPSALAEVTGLLPDTGYRPGRLVIPAATGGTRTVTNTVNQTFTQAPGSPAELARIVSRELAWMTEA